MMAGESSQELLARIKAKQVVAGVDLLPQADELFGVLRTRESALLNLIAPDAISISAPPGPAEDETEFGLMIYWLHYPPDELVGYLAQEPLHQLVFEILRSHAPEPQIKPAHYVALNGSLEYGVAAPGDGTIWGLARYEQLDVRWAFAVFNYTINRILPETVLPFPQGSPEPVVLTPANGQSTLTIGIVGDWGTGSFIDWGGHQCPAERVISQISAQDAGLDWLVHLGDVYYAGTNQRPPPGEELSCFGQLWPVACPPSSTFKSFTLNSNHEMYGDGSGYFTVALGDTPAFAEQKGMSYFAYYWGKWLIVGLDSAYYSDAFNGSHMYMDGAIGVASLYNQQIDWLEQFQGFEGSILVLSHHPAWDTSGSTLLPLYTQVFQALNRAPTAWYWGHTHNGIVYAPDILATTTLGRCCGHGAIPFGNASSLAANGRVKYYAQTPDTLLPGTDGSDPPNPRVRNGYAVVTLNQDGSFDEAFYEVGQQQAVYSGSIPSPT